MKCWHCNTKLIWGGDHDLEDYEEFDLLTNLSCPECGAYVEVYYSIKDNNKPKKRRKKGTNVAK